MEHGFVQVFPHFVDHVILEWIFTHVSGVTSPQGILQSHFSRFIPSKDCAAAAAIDTARRCVRCACVI